MKAILLSVSPKWCELIANGNKTIEVRKTKPKIETPFKCYIYCTNSAPYLVYGDRFDGYSFTDEYCITRGYSREEADKIWGVMNGKVIGEFLCDAVIPISIKYSDPNNSLASREFPFTCLTDKQIIDYLGNGKTGYGWHISDLIIYDEPKKLSEFMKPCIDKYGYCQGCKHGWCNYPEWVETYEDLEGCCFETECLNTVTKAPNSWCYVEELEG